MEMNHTYLWNPQELATSARTRRMRKTFMLVPRVLDNDTGRTGRCRLSERCKPWQAKEPPPF